METSNFAAIFLMAAIALLVAGCGKRVVNTDNNDEPRDNHGTDTLDDSIGEMEQIAATLVARVTASDQQFEDYYNSLVPIIESNSVSATSMGLASHMIHICADDAAIRLALGTLSCDTITGRFLAPGVVGSVYYSSAIVIQEGDYE